MIINSDRSETLVYNNTGVPIFLSHGGLDASKNYTFLSHWHDDMEFELVTEGNLFYNVNGKSVYLKEGDAIFVNSRRLHSSFAPNKTPAKYICLLFHPTLLCTSSYMEDKYIQPVIDDSLDYIIFHSGDPEAETLRNSLEEIYNILGEDNFELRAHRYIFEIWSEVYKHIGKNLPVEPHQSYHLSSLKEMIEFINRHYQEKITLEQIGRAGGFGETSCCRIFKRYTNKTPLNFLIDYRLQKGIELLMATDMSVTEISNRVGFSSPSYFSEMFRKSYNCSPREYKQNNGM